MDASEIIIQERAGNLRRLPGYAGMLSSNELLCTLCKPTSLLKHQILVPEPEMLHPKS